MPKNYKKRSTVNVGQVRSSSTNETSIITSLQNEVKELRETVNELSISKEIIKNYESKIKTLESENSQLRQERAYVGNKNNEYKKILHVKVKNLQMEVQSKASEIKETSKLLDKVKDENEKLREALKNTHQKTITKVEEKEIKFYKPQLDDPQPITQKIRNELKVMKDHHNDKNLTSFVYRELEPILFCFREFKGLLFAIWEFGKILTNHY
ncbi:13879_t:CDS:2 [Ambispora leptoticha]|uniref:13879_t:CDS:1 n=1 Tax=Ambispora leptoticha TaxID=144679 RepID=A0A9N8ZU86_9GLOM|nr:13879_t:CDS:2 [Ambispora leptoticha]